MSRSPLIALQLYTIRAEMAHDFVGTLRLVGDIGYDGVEFAGYGGLRATEMQSLLSETGLQVAGTHIAVDRLQRDLRAEVAFCHAIKCPLMVVPSLPRELHGPERLGEVVALLNDLGKSCREQGLGFAYHNHDFEFFSYGDRTGWEYLVESTDRELVSFELDLFWAAHAGMDAERLLERHRDRIRIVHLKEAARQREVDGPRLDALYARLGQLDVDWVIIEDEEPPAASSEGARAALVALRTGTKR